MTLGQLALKYAIAELGKQEIPLGSNWGPHVRKYLQSVGLDFPAAWCAAFVYWCFAQAAKEMGIPNPVPKTGGVLNMWRLADAKNKMKATIEPQRGDIFIMDYGKGLGHEGIVEKKDATFVYNVEGNTNDSGSREGIEVTRKQRPRKGKIIGYLRY
jgi:hypothetical protein